NARRPNIHPRIQRHPRQSQQDDRAISASGSARLQRMRALFPKVKTEVTGTPIRTELQRLDRKAAREKLGLSADLTTLLVMGGSQGASGINQAMIKSLPSLDGARLQMIQLTGARDEKLVADNYRRAKL